MLNGVTFLIFGAIVLGPALGALSWDLVLYAVLSLTVVRMLPVAVAMVGSRARRADGRVPRLVRPARPGLDRLRRDRDRGVEPPHEGLLVLAIYVTVGLSVFAHGLTAAPLAARYARWRAATRDGGTPVGVRPRGQSSGWPRRTCLSAGAASPSGRAPRGRDRVPLAPDLVLAGRKALDAVELVADLAAGRRRGGR